MHGNFQISLCLSVGQMAAWQGLVQVMEDAVHELPVQSLIHSWNPSVCYKAHSLSVELIPCVVIVADPAGQIAACQHVWSPTCGLLLINHSLKLVPGWYSIPLVSLYKQLASGALDCSTLQASLCKGSEIVRKYCAAPCHVKCSNAANTREFDLSPILCKLSHLSTQSYIYH